MNDNAEDVRWIVCVCARVCICVCACDSVVLPVVVIICVVFSRSLCCSCLE